ncbi:AAA family ATPase, partial [bacterium]|nr:AAA family ATPase [bacterium]
KETERRQATIMFVEISGYNEMLESMDTEEAAAIMSRCLKLFDSIAQKYGTKIDKTAGSSLSILFGIPGAIENAPKNAINVAIELRNTLYQFNKKENLQIPLDIHIGINTGMVIAGALDTDEKKDYSVMGDAVNLASQLKDLCVKGQIYVGPSTYRYTKNEFEYKPLKPITLKSKKEPLRVYELISVKEKIYRARLGTERMIVSEMVGREKELDRLHFHLLKLLNGEGSVVSVIGEAGIGKSRLIAEFRKKAEINRVTLLEGRALSIGRNLSFHPIIDIFKQWSGIKEDDNEAESFHKLENAIRNIYPEGTGEIFPFIATLMGLKLTGKYAERIKGIDGEALEKLILRNLRELLAKAADQRALVFVIEDLHWADLSSIKLLESLYRLAENNCILFINVFRPNYEETGDRILTTIEDRYDNLHSEINLESLNEKQSEIVVNNLLKVKGLPAKIKALIIKRAEGNPFFIEEVVRSFIDEGIVVIKDGGFNVTEKIESVVIPETINEVLMARIDKLDENTRSLVKVASVIGRNFFYKILFEVTEEIEDIDERLVYLEKVQLILERRRMAEVEYLFKHALAQQAAYDSILIKQRKKLHLKVAQSIETVFKERLQDFFGTLALHYSLGEDLDRAENYLIKAGEESLKSSASSEALHYYQEALDIYRRKCGDTVNTEKIAMLEKNIAIALFNTGHNEEAVEYFERVLAYYGVRAPKHPIAVILKLLIGLLDFMIKLEFQFLMGKKIPAQKEIEIFDLTLKKISAIAVTDPKRMFIEMIIISRLLTKLDQTKVEHGAGSFVINSVIFSLSGISFRLSRKILEFSKNKINKNDVKSLLAYDFAEVGYNLLTGNWGADCYDEKLMNQGLNIGELFIITTCHVWHGQISIERGNPDAQRIVDKLSEIADVYDNDYAKELKFRLR